MNKIHPRNTRMRDEEFEELIAPHPQSIGAHAIFVRSKDNEHEAYRLQKEILIQKEKGRLDQYVAEMAHIERQLRKVGVVEDSTTAAQLEMIEANIESQKRKLKDLHNHKPPRDFAGPMTEAFFFSVKGKKLVVATATIDYWDIGTAQQTLKDLRASIKNKREQIRLVDAHSLTKEEAINRVKGDCEARANRGAAKLRNTAMMVFTDGGMSHQGHVRLPQMTLRMSDGSICDTDDAASFMFWIFRDQIQKRLISEVQKMDFNNAIAMKDRKTVKADLRAELLALERKEEATVRWLEERGVPVYRRPNANPFAVFGARLATSDDTAELDFE